MVGFAKMAFNFCVDCRYGWIGARKSQVQEVELPKPPELDTRVLDLEWMNKGTEEMNLTESPGK